MLKASALYIVIVIALVISVLCSAVIVAGYYHREVYARSIRYERLRNNLSSGTELLLAATGGMPEQKISLFGDTNDSMIVKKGPWGIFDIAALRAFIQHDTLDRCFLTGNVIDKQKWAALYIIDEDRSISVSGDTRIKGTAFIPKAGIREAYVDNKAYTGDKRLIIGTKKDSEKKLPELNKEILKGLESIRNSERADPIKTLPKDSDLVSFLSPARYYDLGKNVQTLKNIRLIGNIILRSDTTLLIDSSAHLDNILVFARGIVVKEGFRGTCQLFASDSIYVERNCRFDYPSCLAIVNFDEHNKQVKRLSVEEGTKIDGVILIHDNHKAQLPPVISLGKQVKVNGQIYVAGLLNLKNKVQISGSVFTDRFLYQSTYTRYENYLIDLELDADKLSPYYLTSGLLPVASKKQKVLQWLR